MSGEGNRPDIAVISPEAESLGLIVDPPDAAGWDLAGDMGVFRPTPGSNVIVDDSPLQNQMERNKESLKVKLMVRRPFDTLVEQGIVPSPKTSPFLHEQRQKLERAKMGDMLRAKIAKRPDRQELVHRHILEDVPAGVDPSLCDKQRQLKRAKLADSLSNQLQLRPGPLELIQKNILHTDDTAVEQAVKEGQIQFRPTNDGLPFKQVELPEVYTVNSFDEDSSDGGLISPPSSVETVQKSESTDSVFPALVSQSGGGHERRSSDVSQFAVPSPPPCSLSANSSTSSKISSSTSSLSNHQAYSQRGAPGKERKIKKPKAKGTASTAKTRTIKFHEYKGPPSAAQKRPNSEEVDAKSAEDSRYKLLLKQQQLFLQWQLELSHKYPQILLPAAPSSSSNVGTPTMKAVSGAESSVASSSTTKFNFVPQTSLAAKYQPQLSSGSSQGSIASVPSPATSAPPTPRANTPSRTLVIGFGSNPASSEDSARLLEKMEAMKVTDLKAELKKRNLPTSGPKNALIERLKPHLEAMIVANGGTLRLKLGGQSPSSRATSVGRTSKESSPMNIGSEGVAMDALSQPSTPMAFQEMTGGSPSPMAFNSQDSNALTSPLRTIRSMEQHSPLAVASPRSNMDLDHFDLDLMDTDRSQASPAPPPPPTTTTVVTTSPIRTNNSKNTVLVNSQGSPTIITLPRATEMIPATLPTVLPKPMTIIPPPPPPPPPPSRRKASILSTSTSKTPSFTITPVMSTVTTASTSTLAQSQLQILPMAQIHTTRAEPIVIQVPQAPKVLTTNGILSNLAPTRPQLSVLPTSSVVQRDNSHDLIREQQKKIEELQSALQKSQSQLLEQAKILSQQQSQLNAANNNSPGAIPSSSSLAMREQNANHMKMLMAQQMQNNQLQNQIQQLQAMQMKVQEHEQQVKQTLTTVRQSTTQMTPSTQTSASSTSSTSSSTGDEQREIRIVMDDGQHFILKKDLAQQLRWAGQDTPNHMPHVSNHNQSQVRLQNLTNNCIQHNTDLRLASHTNGTAITSTGVSQVTPKVKNEPKIESHDPLVEEMLSMLSSSNNSSDPLRYGIAPPPPPPPYNHHHSKPISAATPPLNDILAFDINDFELPALENIDFTHQVNSHHQFNNDPAQCEGEGPTANGNSTDGMDVDQDVADWLDSLLPQNSVMNNVTNGFTPTKINTTPDEELNGNVPPCWTMDSFNKGGSSNVDFGTSTHFLADDFLA